MEQDRSRIIFNLSSLESIPGLLPKRIALIKRAATFHLRSHIQASAFRTREDQKERTDAFAEAL